MIKDNKLPSIRDKNLVNYINILWILDMNQAMEFSDSRTSRELFVNFTTFTTLYLVLTSTS